MTKRYEYNRTWRQKHPDQRHAEKVAYRQRTGSHTGPNLHTRWTPDEDELVLAHAVADRVLAQTIGRSVGAIHVRRNRLVKQAEPDG